MNQTIFNEIFAHYPDLIRDMDDTFTSHKFILHLAQRYQTEYIELLYHYRHSPNTAHPTPFKIVHGFLAKHLSSLHDLVTNIGEVDSKDIFTGENRCAEWRKVS